MREAERGIKGGYGDEFKEVAGRLERGESSESIEKKMRDRVGEKMELTKKHINRRKYMSITKRKKVFDNHSHIGPVPGFAYYGLPKPSSLPPITTPLMII